MKAGREKHPQIIKKGGGTRGVKKMRNVANLREQKL